MLVSLELVKKIYGGKEVLHNVTAKIEDGDRIGLIGVNGAGKTTLLNLICGAESPDTGEVARANNKSIGYLKQNSGLSSNRSIYEEMELAFADVLAAQSEMKQLEKQMEQGERADLEQLAVIYAERQTFFEQNEGYLIEVKIKTVLNGMGFSEKSLDTPIETLSGGEKTRLAMAKLLLTAPDLLILDEPTNHLDFDTLQWLEGYLDTYRGAILVVSHDRYFLDRCVTKIWEIEKGKLDTYPGSYSKYRVLKEERIRLRQKEYEYQQNQIASMQEYVNKNIARASTSNSAKSRIHAMERMELVEKPEVGRRVSRIHFTYEQEPVKEILQVQNLSLAVGEERRVLSEDLNFIVERGDKIAVIGPNGVGKSTLLKTLLGQAEWASGEYHWGRNTRIGYFEQEQHKTDAGLTALEALWSKYPAMSEHAVRSALGAVLLSGEDVYKKVNNISGGERAKLRFADLMLQQSNVLILDEPTNHLDLRSKEVLEQALIDFAGTIILVSHDRYLLNRVPNKILEILPRGSSLFTGQYDQYIQQIKPLIDPVEKEVKPKKIGGYRTKQQRSLEVRQKARLRELEREIDQCDQQMQQWEKELNLPEVFADYQRVEDISAQMEQCKYQQEQLFLEWEGLAQKMDGQD